MKTLVEVTLRAECTVQIEVEHEAGEDPRDLSAAEENTACNKGESFPDWEVRSCFQDVRVIKAVT